MTLSDRERRVLAHIETQLRLHRPSPLWRLYGLFLLRRYRRTMPYPYRPPRRVRAPRPRFRPRPGLVARHGAHIIAVLVVALALAVGVIVGLSLAG